jgi:ubiquinone/menaquinone biosynthesis C-methylase UbiE
MNPPSFAETYERVLVPEIFRPWAIDLLDRVRPRPVERVLDLACGTGIVGRLVRERYGAETRIAGVDLNPEMIAIARSIAPDIEWHVANVLSLPFDASSFDLVLCQQALQFFPHRAAAVREMRRVLSDRGRIAFSTWRPIEENPLFFRLHSMALRRFGPHVDRRFTFGNAAPIRALLVDAGFHDVRIETIARTERVVDAKRFVAMNLSATVDRLDDMTDDQRAEAISRFVADVRETIKPFANGSELVHPVSANMVTAVV